MSAGFASLNLVKPGELYGDRINQVDIRAAKIVRYGRTRTNIAVDLFNIFNANPVLTYNQSVPSLVGGAAYLSPTCVVGAPCQADRAGRLVGSLLSTNRRAELLRPAAMTRHSTRLTLPPAQP
jgi:hypothetical protein